MATLSATQQRGLRQLFGPRVSFDKEERRIYSHDVGALPRLIKPVIGAATADAVVQPENEAELVELVHWANANRVHLIPRAKATSGYGGVMPVKGGISVCLTRLNRLLHSDPENLRVRVQPGMVWGNLEELLAKQNLALRTYPSSAPSSTVGGWLAQGGVGYGAFEYDAFRTNVLEARLVLPNGDIRSFQGEELDLVSDAEGITGFITEVTLQVRRLEPERVEGILFPTATALTRALQELVEARASFWSVSFTNPTMARLKNQVPPKTHHGHPVDTTRPQLPEDGYLALFAAPEGRWPTLLGQLREAAARHGGAPADRQLVDHEWEGRFDLMHIKRLGPSLLPAEAIVPLKNLDRMLDELDRAIKQPLTLEGMVQTAHADGNSAWVTLIGFIPHDERTLGFGMAYSLSLTLVAKAMKYGGRPYSTGLYFTSQAGKVLGRERLHRLKAFKQSVDPKGILNPRKVYDSGSMGHLLGAILPFEPLARIPANLFKSPVGERVAGQGRRGIPDETAWYAYACAQCGYCVDSCTEYFGQGWESRSPRGKWYFLRDYMEGRAELTQDWVNSFLACTTCEVCNSRCPLELPIEPAWLSMRQDLVQNKALMTYPPFEMMRAATQKECNIWGAYRKQRTEWIPDDIRQAIPERAEVAYFTGCTASLVEKDVAIGTARLLRAAGVEFTYLGEEEGCCGLPILCSGHWDTFEEIFRHNLAAMQKRGVKTVVTSCPACWLSWHTYYPQWAEKLGIPFDFEVRHYSELLADKLRSGEMKFTHEVPKTVTWHDSCHIGRAGGVYEPPRDLIKAIPGITFREMEFNRENAHCCGSVLSLLEDPDKVALNIGARRIQEAGATGAEALIALCPCCEVQLRVSARKSGIDIPVVDLAHLAAQGLGVELADPTDYALEQWATFEAMIKLLKPEAMAEFMAPLLPQMIEAMPTPLGGMMKWVKDSAPGPRHVMLSIMRPMMPRLFPLLLPGMLPKLLPDFMAAMDKAIPMPEHLREQMPELLPEVMQELMPKMLPGVLPFLVPKVEAYLDGRQELSEAA